MVDPGNTENFMRYIAKLNDLELSIHQVMTEFTMDLVTSMDDPLGSFKFKLVEPSINN